MVFHIIAVMQQKIENPAALRQVAALAKLMDNQFAIPGTNIRFGLDSIIGLIPGAGDIAGLGISGYMLLIMARNGASGFVMARMVLNVLIDTLFGSIPILGDIFDMAFKSNIKNLRLMQQHYQEGRHRGSAWKIVLPVMLVLIIVIGAIVYGIYVFLAWGWHAISK